MNKVNFDNWNKVKKELDESTKDLYCHTRQIWFIYIGQNVGYEQSGHNGEFLRPVLIYKKFNEEIFWGIPLTKKNKEGKYYFRFEIPNIKKDYKSYAVLSQLKLFDTKRLKYRIGIMTKKDFISLKEKLIDLINE